MIRKRNINFTEMIDIINRKLQVLSKTLLMLII